MLTILRNSWLKVWQKYDDFRWWWRERTAYRLGKTDLEWDNEVQALAMVFEFEFEFEPTYPPSRFIVKLGPYILWVQNFPYSSFYRTEPDGGWRSMHNTRPPYKLPSLRTQYFLKEKLERERATWSNQ
jgi:hypothetical protein